jgi:acyl CoA:acetate/3-ketoacid CoA transferase beta subunit
VVVVKHVQGRLAKSVPNITAPGHRVTAVVTTRAVFERAGDELILTGYFGSGGESAETIGQEIQADTGGPLTVSDSLRQVPDAEPGELDILRRFDPESLLLNKAR